MTLRHSAAGMTLTVRSAEAATLPHALAYRIQVALQTLFGDDCSLKAWPGGLSVTLKPDRQRHAAATGVPRAETACVHPTFHPLEKEFHHATSLAPEDDADDLRRMLLALLPALAIGSEAQAQDATKMQPGAYRLALDNDRLRVLDFRSRPGLGVCGAGMHSHPAHLTVALSAGNVRIKTPDGKQFTAANQLGEVF